MSEEIHTKLLVFLASVLGRAQHDMVQKLELIYTPQSGYRAEPLKTWRRDDPSDRVFFELDEGGGPNPVYSERLAGDMLELATGHADSFGEGRHRFMVRAHKHVGGYLTHAFAILPSFQSADQALVAGGGSGGGSTELAPTQSGLVSQLMRHLENRDRNAREMMQSYINGMTHQAVQQREEIDSLRSQLAAQQKERMEWLDTIEQARSQDHQRQIEALTATSREERKSHAAKKIINLLPVALSHWMSSKTKKKNANGEVNGTPVTRSPLAALVYKLFDSLTEEQRAGVAAALSMEQQILLVEISDVVESGGSVLLPTMLHDLASSLLQPQMSAIMTLMTSEQRVMFAQAVGLAQAQAAPQPDGKPDGAKTPETEVS